jgi:ABC-type nitrate/sulfonate/bicarbonate transport system ATPase subunit
MSASLTFAKVGKTYLRPSAAGRETVLRDFSLEVRAGELVAIVGRSGIGKTTLPISRPGSRRRTQARSVWTSPASRASAWSFSSRGCSIGFP